MTGPRVPRRKPRLGVVVAEVGHATPIDLGAWIQAYVNAILRHEGVTAPPTPGREAA